MKEYQISVSNPDANTFTGALGIDDERAKFLAGKLDEARIEQSKKNERGDISQLLQEATEHCENANELAFVCFITGQFVADMENQMRMQQLFNIGNPKDLQEG